MKFRLEFTMDNAAFDILPLEESIDILKTAIEKLETNGFTPDDTPTPLRDSNGNRVGQFCIES